MIEQSKSLNLVKPHAGVKKGFDEPSLPRRLKVDVNKSADIAITQATESKAKSNFPPLLPVAEIYVADPARFSVDTSSEAFHSFKESVREKGIVQPIITGEKDERGYPLYSGSRRFLACRQLGKQSIPAMIIPVMSREELYAIQMIADLVREDLEPLDEAKLYEKYFTARHSEMKLDDMISHLITYERHPERRDDKFAGTVPAILNLSGGKSASTIKTRLCLLRLPEEIQEAIRNKVITVSLGDIFAVHHDDPKIREVFKKALAVKKLTKSALKSLFETVEKSGKRKKPTVVKRCLKSLDTIRQGFQSDERGITETDVTILLSKLEALRAYLEDKRTALSQAGTIHDGTTEG